jgi:hypothetical protein
MVFTDPKFVIPKRVKRFREGKVLPQLETRVLVISMVRGEKNARP